MDEKPLYLVMVTEENNNKFYRMIPDEGGNTFTVEYGRVGNSYVATENYSIDKWDKKLHEKLRKGYVDQTRLVATPTVTKNEPFFACLGLQIVQYTFCYLLNFQYNKFQSSFFLHTPKNKKGKTGVCLSDSS